MDVPSFPWRRLRRLLLCAVAIPACAALACDRPEPTPPPVPATQPVTRPTTEPSTQPVADAKPFTRYTDVLLNEQPHFPSTRPTTAPLAIDEAARLIFDEPLFLDAVSCVWIHHERGQSPQDLVRGGELNRETFVTNERVVFSWWKTGHDGKPTVELILERPDGGFDWLHVTGRAPIPPPPTGHDFDWNGAFVYYDAIVVPTIGGVATVTPHGRPDAAQFFRRYGRSPEERRPDGSGTVTTEHHALANPGEQTPATQVRLDGQGLIAWVPWTSRRKPGGVIARHLNGAWSPLIGNGWAEKPVHLMPLSDGSVLQLALNEKGEADLTAVPLNVVNVDRDNVATLVENLSSRDARQREAAFVALAQFGPGAWPTMEALKAEQPPAAQKQLDVLLGDKTQPTLGGLTPEPGPVEVREWLGDGGVILKFNGGIRLPDAAGITLLERPAWLVVRPGQRTQLLDRMIASELSADLESRVYVWGDEWIVARPGEPPKRWLINHFEPLLEEARAEWQTFVGVDQAGRWIFRKPNETTPTLIVDVRLPDPLPRLPTWLIEVGGGLTGWDDAGWPVMEAGGAWRLKEEDWEPLPEGESPNVIAPMQPKGLLTTATDGTVYRNGIDALELTSVDGRTTTWRLPAEAVGAGAPKAVLDGKGRVFLFNRPGRVVRIKPTPGAAEPFAIEAIFDEDLPGGTPDRVWLDPAGRICATYFGNTVAVMWPDGQVPASIRQKMPSKRRGEGGQGNPLQGV